MPNVQRDSLSPENERRLRDLADSSDLTMQRRARLILRWHAGDTQAEIAEAIGLSVSGVSHWVRQYREQQMAIFGLTDESHNNSIAVDTASDLPTAIPEVVPEAVAPEPAALPKPRRGRPKAAPKAPAASVPEPEPEPVPEAVVEPPAPTPVKPRRGRPAKNAKAVSTAEPTPAPKITPTQPEANMIVAKPARKKPTRAPRVPVAEAAPEAKIPAAPAIPQPPPEPPKPVPTVRGLIEFYGVYLKHAQHVAAQAVYLFDVTAETHRLPDRARRLLEAGALLHNVAYRIDPENHQHTGRDLIEQTPLQGFNDDERHMIALLAALHRGKVHAEQEPLYQALAAELRDDTLALVALLRLADGCDRSQTQSTEIIDAVTEPGELLIQVRGPQRSSGKPNDQTEADAQCISSKADLWERLYGQRVRVQIVSDDELAANLSGSRVLTTLTVPPALRDLMPDLTIKLDPAISSGWAFRQLAQHYVERLARLATRLQSGELNKLSALSRELERLAGVLNLAGLTRFDAELTWLADKSHAAQTALAITDRASALAADLDDAQAALVQPGLAGWQQQSQTALDWIEDDRDRLTALIGDLRQELGRDVPDEGELAGPISARVALIVWQNLTELRESVERGDSVYKALLAAYRLQDTLLYFRSLLSPEANQALDLLTPFEAYLTTIYGVQSTLIALESKRHPADTPEGHAVEALQMAQNRTLEELADSLPALWTSVNSPQFRRAVALAVAKA